jgi:hydroxylamine reductase
MNNKMFCFQCQETAGNKGCTLQGVCGKKPEVAQLQDLLVWTTKGLCEVTSRLRDEGKTIDKKTNHLITQNLFITITNANFDASAITKAIEKTLAVKVTLLSQLNNKSKLPDAATWTGEKDTFSTKAATIGILSSMEIDEDIRSLRELITYGLKGLAAYMKHANALLFDKAELDAFVQRALASTLDDSLSLDALVTLTMETGKAGVDVMALLDKANTSRYGNPEITKVNLGVRNNSGILISGHDLKDLEMLLEQTQGTGVDVYTHSEMLPAHYYPAFKRYPHFVGNYGNAWWK